MIKRDRLIIFTRYPQPGKAKTRLIPALGAAAAADLQRQMTEHTLEQVESLILTTPVSVDIWFAGSEDESHLMRDWLGSRWQYSPQGAGDLGDRMAQAFASAFATGAAAAVTIGTDCPGLDAARMAEAFQALQDHDLVLGAATDGGYYLIGLRRMVPELFVGIDWSTERVLTQTIAIARSLGLKVATLERLSDIDRPEDLPVWEAVLQAKAAQNPAQNPAQNLQERESAPLSVIIPVLNEAGTIEGVLKALQPEAVEIIVVDGGSQDNTIALAQAFAQHSANIKIISAAPGRANQMNAGAAIASGKILLFLHADTCLPSGFPALVTQALDGAIAGAFALHIAGDMLGIRWVERGVHWRSRFLQLPYGDQAIFLKASQFRAIGGFADLPIMEDFELVRRLQKLGKIAIVSAPVLTSDRRWQKLGILKTTLINQVAVIAYFLGVSPDRIARWYHGKSRH
ncbi:MAG: TIGR04283 family arsenosugar biosynthesis glycosyltransferase [Drouetiella hepatica Uher 2000/2452]|uniref:TIGR04283 family arsenosugar biosynthesis glycosyltransferase n=1 Tax=Drouetiella hepatica Uher 2000/2452 TaxID=904376 RepID=A0A951UL15_9CYAN|nr:TIGR04283 family arsenosugar biosynthesis glycosyltransferase [Drouetiella hepatica Uher 2000/2452]